MKLIIVRHVQTIFNREGRLQGSLDSGLTAVGYQQLKALSEALAEYSFTKVYSSPLGRTIETCKRLSSEYQLSTLLREQCFGQYEGRLLTEIETIDPMLMSVVRGERINHKLCEQSESFGELQMRALCFLDFIRQRHSREETILAVSHGNFIKALLSSIANNKLGEVIPKSQLTHFNGAFSEVNIDHQGRPCLLRWGVATHLKGLL